MRNILKKIDGKETDAKYKTSKNNNEHNKLFIISIIQNSVMRKEIYHSDGKKSVTAIYLRSIGIFPAMIEIFTLI